MPHALLIDHIRDPHASWACGRFGAIAEFHRDADEPVEIPPSRDPAATDRGAIRIERFAGLRPVAYETISKCIDSWGQGVALCLPRELAAMSGPHGRDRARTGYRRRRPQVRDALLFDLGLGGAQAETCVRSADPETVALLRSVCGQPLFARAHVCFSVCRPQPASRLLLPARPHRGLSADPRAGRNVAGRTAHPCPAAAAGERPRSRRHRAGAEGWLAGMTLFPAHPLYARTGKRRPRSMPRVTSVPVLMDDMAIPRCWPASRLLSPRRIASRQRGQGNARRAALGLRIARRQSKWLQAPSADGRLSRNFAASYRLR